MNKNGLFFVSAQFYMHARHLALSRSFPAKFKMDHLNFPLVNSDNTQVFADFIFNLKKTLSWEGIHNRELLL